MGFSEFFTTLDYFGVQINFNFKSQNYYRSTYGGSIFLIYVVLCIAYIAYTFTSFLQKKHKTAIYYDKELFATDEIYFHKYNSSFAANMVCDNYNGEYGDIYSKFIIQPKHVQYLKMNGELKKTKTLLPFHKCTYNDFYNKFNEELDRNEITNNFYCIDNMNYTVKGIFADEDFEYYELTLSATLEKGFNKRTYLEVFYKYDCKFSLYYIDSAVDVANVSQPMRPFLNSRFIQITPTEFKKVNLFYTIKNFKSDENWFFTLPKERNYLAFSSFEEYDVFKGENRFNSDYEDYEKFARFFIRASATRNIIERRYEKFTEFVASSISVLSAILLFLNTVIRKINNYLALKEIVDTLCIGQKINLEKKINLKIKLNNLKNYTNKFKRQKKLNISKDENKNNNEKEEVSITSNKLNKSEYPNNQKTKSTIVQFGGSIVKEINNIYCDNSQSKINSANNLNMLNAKISSAKINNYLINEVKNESENFNSFSNNINKNKYYNFDSNNFCKNPNLSEIFNKVTFKNEDNSGLKFKLNGEQKKNEFILDKKLYFNSNEKFDTKIKNKFTVLNNNIQASILGYKICKFFSNCLKNNKNNGNALENSLNYLTKSLDIFTYLKIIKNQDVLINILFNTDDYDLFKKLESLHFNSNNIFDTDNIYITNKGKRRKSNINDLDGFWGSFIQLRNKTNKTHTEKKLIELIVREINTV